MVESITYMIIYVIARVCMWLCCFNVGWKYRAQSFTYMWYPKLPELQILTNLFFSLRGFPPLR